jgi:hypothetical protein
MASFEKIVFLCHQGCQRDGAMLPSRVSENPSVSVFPNRITDHANKSVELLLVLSVADFCAFPQPPLLEGARLGWLLERKLQSFATDVPNFTCDHILVRQLLSAAV